MWREVCFAFRHCCDWILIWSGISCDWWQIKIWSACGCRHGLFAYNRMHNCTLHIKSQQKSSARKNLCALLLQIQSTDIMSSKRSTHIFCELYLLTITLSVFRWFDRFFCTALRCRRIWKFWPQNCSCPKRIIELWHYCGKQTTKCW